MRIQTQLLIINFIGGIAVLGGYVVALINHPHTRNDLWGGVPESLRPWICLLYTSPSPRDRG